MRQLKYINEMIVMMIPSALLLLSFLCSFLTYDYYTYVVLDNLFGYSIITNLVFLKVYIFDGKSKFNKFAVCGLFFINFLCIFNKQLEYDKFSTFYNFSIIFIVFTLKFCHLLNNEGDN